MTTKISVIALMKITSKHSDGRAKIVACVYPKFIARDHLTSREFQAFEVGELVIARVQYTFESKRRVLASHPRLFLVEDGAGTHKGIESEFYGLFADELNRNRTSFVDVMKVFEDKPVEDAPIRYAPKFITKPEAISIMSGAFEAAVVDRILSMPHTPLPDPQWCDSFFVQDEERNAFGMAKSLSGTIPSKIMIIGPSGYGKTSLPRAFAKQNHMNYVRFNVALVRDPEEFFGWRTVEDGNVKFIPSEFTKAIIAGNSVVVLDELNRATPEMANALFPILDDDARTVVFGQEIVVGPNTIIVATINVGYQFVGTFSIDQALLNRMDITLRVAPLPRAVEVEILKRRTNIDQERAEKIVAVCNRLRDLSNDGKIIVDASTRTSIRVARFIVGGATYQDAFAWAVVNSSDVEERKEIIDTISSVL